MPVIICCMHSFKAADVTAAISHYLLLLLLILWLFTRRLLMWILVHDSSFGIFVWWCIRQSWYCFLLPTTFLIGGAGSWLALVLIDRRSGWWSTTSTSAAFNWLILRLMIKRSVHKCQLRVHSIIHLFANIISLWFISEHRLLLLLLLLFFRVL
jgi:hypothetical protein